MTLNILIFCAIYSAIIVSLVCIRLCLDRKLDIKLGYKCTGCHQKLISAINEELAQEIED